MGFFIVARKQCTGCPYSSTRVLPTRTLMAQSRRRDEAEGARREREERERGSQVSNLKLNTRHRVRNEYAAYYLHTTTSDSGVVTTRRQPPCPWRLAGSNLGRIWGAEAPALAPAPAPALAPGRVSRTHLHALTDRAALRLDASRNDKAVLVSLSASRQHPRGVVRAGSSLSEQSRGSAAAAAPHPRDAHAAGATERQ